MTPTSATDARSSWARASDARAPERGPMAHRAPGFVLRPSAPRPSAARPSGLGRSRVPAPLAGALAAEAAELTGLARRVVPNRRVAIIVGLALVALVAVGGIAGAAEPKPVQRSALEAFSASSAPATGSATTGSALMTPAAAQAAAVLVATPSPATASGAPSALADDPAFKGPDLLDLGAKTVLVLTLLFVTLRVLRRVQGAGPTRGSGTLAVLESRPLGPKTQLHLIAVGDRRIVVGQSPAGLVALGELDAAELPAPDAVREPWARRDALDDDPELESQLAHELATGRRPRLGVSA